MERKLERFLLYNRTSETNYYKNNYQKLFGALITAYITLTKTMKKLRTDSKRSVFR